MELRKGYKQTDAGIIPIDWTINKIGEFTDVQTGGTPSTYIQEYWDGDIRWMNSGELNLKKVYDVENRITDLGLKNSATRIIPKNCILIGLAGQGKTRGTAAINKIELCTNQSIAAILPCENIDYNYLYFNLDSRYLELRGLSTGDGGRGGLNLTIIKNLQIPLPRTKSEQTAIATALSDADALISSLEKLIEKKRNIKQGAMQQLLKPNKGWAVKKLGDLISFILDNRGKTPPLENNGHPLIEVNAIYKQGKSPNYNLVSKFVSQFIYDNWFRDGHPKRNDILVVTVGSAGATSFVNEVVGCIAQNIIALRIENSYSPEFVYYFTLTRSFKDQVAAVLMGAVQPSLKVPHLKDFEISMPDSRAEQNEIATIISDMDNEITSLEKKLSKSKMLKQGMMQELLTGKIRLV